MNEKNISPLPPERVKRILEGLQEGDTIRYRAVGAPDWAEPVEAKVYVAKSGNLRLTTGTFLRWADGLPSSDWTAASPMYELLWSSREPYRLIVADLPNNSVVGAPNGTKVTYQSVVKKAFSKTDHYPWSRIGNRDWETNECVQRLVDEDGWVLLASPVGDGAA